MSNKRYVSVIYCDDVRAEIGNKLSYMGIYQNELLISKLPSTLLKLCIVITVFTPKDEPFKELEFKVFRDDDVLAIKKMDDEINNNMSTAVLTIAPFAIEKPCKLKVRVKTESDELIGLPLTIKQV